MKSFIFVALLTGFISMANAGFNEGLESYNAGNYKLAFKNFSPLAKQGDAQAQFNLGVIYDKGQGVLQDYVQAIAWYRKAAEQGHVDAQRTMGFQYFMGQGVPPDYAQAFNWYRKAAEQGDAAAQGSIGLMFAEGIGVAKDDAQALSWLRKGAEQGDNFAQFSLGMRYVEGKGVQQNWVVAFALFNIANLDAIPNGYKQKSLAMKALSRKTYGEGRQLTSEMAKPNNLIKAIAAYLKNQAKR
ncbi:MAG: tetratricopeptide repeat protein [Proteobacteria bacterium]|nr:tetratricopeptide repeat protein [Pseudomonadota bacterium]